jgi:RNA-directed DNA polymerase
MQSSVKTPSPIKDGGQKKASRNDTAAKRLSSMRFQLLRHGIAPESLEKFKANARELWDGRRSRTSNQLRDEWNLYVKGWWEYFQLVETPKPIANLMSWVRGHIRKCFWLRWHSRRGRERHLRRLGLDDKALGVATSRRGARRVAKQPELHKALSNAVLKKAKFFFPSVLAAT